MSVMGMSVVMSKEQIKQLNKDKNWKKTDSSFKIHKMTKRDVRNFKNLIMKHTVEEKRER